MKQGDMVAITIFAQVEEPLCDGSGAHVNVHGVRLTVQGNHIQREIPMDSLSEDAQRLLQLFYQLKGQYIAGWTLGERMGTQDLIGAAHILSGYPKNAAERAMCELVTQGIVEEMPDLGERWRLTPKGKK